MSTFNQSAAPVRIIEYGFATNHLLTISLVRKAPDKEYKSPYFAFFSGAPAGKNGNDKTYLRDQEHSVNFKLDLPRLNAVRFALIAYANGTGQNIGKNYIHWADPSKANDAPNSKITKGKNFSISAAANTKAPGERLVTIAFNSGKLAENGNAKNEDKGVSFQLTFHPFEAMAIADAIQYIIAKARELETVERGQVNGKGVTQPKEQNVWQRGDTNTAPPPEQSASPGPATGKQANSASGSAQGSAGAAAPSMPPPQAPPQTPPPSTAGQQNTKNSAEAASNQRFSPKKPQPTSNNRQYSSPPAGKREYEPCIF